MRNVPKTRVPSAAHAVALALAASLGLGAAAALAETPPPLPAAAEVSAPPAPPVPPTVPMPPGADLTVGVDIDDDGAGVQVLSQVPPDVRAKLDADQLERIVRRAQENQSTVPQLVGVLAPASFFLCIFAVVCAVLFARFRRERQLHETLRQMIDRGVDIPPALLVPPQVKPNDRRRGVILIALGVGISAFLFLVDGNDDGAWGLGLVPAFLGAGYLLASYLGQRDDA